MADSPVFFNGNCLLFAVGGQTAAQFRKVHFVTVKFGAVNTGKLGFAAHGYAASAAHANAVNHDGVEADRGFNAKRTGGFGHGGHHGHGAHGNHFKHVFVGLKSVAQKFGNQTLVPVAAVIGRDEQLVHKGFEFVFKKQQIFARR